MATRAVGMWLGLLLALSALPVASFAAESPTPATCGAACHWFAFERAWQAGDLPTADRELQLARAIKPLINGDRTSEYLIFERNVCDLDAIPPERRPTMPYLVRGLMLCQAMARGPDLPPGLRGEILNAREDLDPASSLFDFYARQPTLNLRALRWLKAQGLDEHRTHWMHDDGGALLAQIRAGRVANVVALLDLGYPPDDVVPVQGQSERRTSEVKDRLGVLPLQTARETLGRHPSETLQIARVLLERGASPYPTAWYVLPPADPETPEATPAQIQEFENLLASARVGHDPVGVRFLGFLKRAHWYSELDMSNDEFYLRLLVGNGSDKPVRIPAWKKPEGWDLDVLHTSEVEMRPIGATRWHQNLLIQDGWSPNKRLVLAPGASREVLFYWNREALGEPAGYEYRVWFKDDEGRTHSSQPFRLQDRDKPMLYESVDSKTDLTPAKAQKRLYEEDATPDPKSP
jgi:hypothetical protein